MARLGSNVRIADTAVVGVNAVIGSNTVVGDYSVIGNDVLIGENCVIYNGVTILGNTVLGNDNKVFPNAVLGTQPQDLKYSGEDTKLVIGDNNIIREHCMFNPGTAGGGGVTRIGNGNLFMAFVHVAHDCVVGNDNILANCVTLGGHVEIASFVNIGGMTPVHQFVRIGDGAMIAGASALSQDVPPYCMAEGNRATIIGLNKFRMRKIMSSERIDAISSFYKRLFTAKVTIKELAENELTSTDNPDLLAICSFIIGSSRGIPYKRGNSDG